MCTIGRTAGGTAGKAHHRTDRAQYPHGTDKKRKDNGAKWCRSSFWSAPRFCPDHCRVPSWKTPEETGTISSRRKITNSCVILISVCLPWEKCYVQTYIWRNNAKLHEEMEILVGEELNVNIEEQNGRLLFRLWKTHRWGCTDIVLFPGEIPVEALGPELETHLHHVYPSTNEGKRNTDRAGRGRYGLCADMDLGRNSGRDSGGKKKPSETSALLRERQNTSTAP